MKSAKSTPCKSSIVSAILTYLVDHPQAQDTVEGIVEWWLLEQRIKWSTMQVKAVLKRLTDEHYVLTRTDTTGRVYYQVNRQKMQEIRQLMTKEGE